MVRQFDWLTGHLYPRAMRALHVVYAIYTLASRSFLLSFLLLLVRVNFNRAVRGVAIMSRDLIGVSNNVELNPIRYLLPVRKYFNKRKRDADVGKYLEEIKANEKYLIFPATFVI